MNTLYYWLLIAGMGAITFALRLSIIAALERLDIPPVIWGALRYVPPAVLTAIIFPELFRPAGTVDLSLGNARLFAGILAVLVAWRTRNVLLTIGVGMIVTWLWPH